MARAKTHMRSNPYVQFLMAIIVIALLFILIFLVNHDAAGYLKNSILHTPQNTQTSNDQ